MSPKGFLTEFGTAVIKYDPPLNLVTSFEESAKKFATNRFIGQKNAQGVYEWATYREIYDRIATVRSALAQLGVKKGDKVGIIAGNCQEWFIGENATHGLGAVWVPMYEKELISVWKYIITDAEIKVLFVATAEIAQIIQEMKKELPRLEKIIVIKGTGTDTLKDLEEKGKMKPIAAIYPDTQDIAVIIYTSGTTGDPKGVLLSHGNLTFCSQSGYHIYPELNETSVALSMLPWAHSYAISAELHNFMQFGGSIGIMGTLETLSADLEAVRPTHLMTVPRLFNKIYAGIWAKMKEEGGLKLTLFKAAIAAATDKLKTGKASFKFKILDKVVLKKIRAKLGGRVIGALTASAKMDTEVANFFFGIGVPTYDCFGMTETSPALTMNRPGAFKIGSVGQPVEKTQIVIDTSVVDDDSGDGEILAFGPQVMIGYHKKPEKTAEIIVERNGIRGVRTGDRGHLDSEGYLYITGRFKEEYKLLNGKYVHPASIEQAMKVSPWVLNAFVFGENKDYNVALVVPDVALLEKYLEEEGKNIPAKEIFTNSELQAHCTAIIQATLKNDFGSYEIPKKMLFISEDFTLDNQMLTQTMKLKRKNVLNKYQAIINKMYE
jgi:long-chain acyl-CoA synthetase